jgi:hypothetical protein
MMEDLDRDIREHIAMETQDNIERGMSPEEARYAAMRKFGNVTKVKEATREVWSFVWLEQLLKDILFGLRTLLKSPGFTAAAILTLALGIGVNTAIFSLIDAVMLRSMPVENPSRLVLLKWSARNAPNTHGYQSAGDCPTDLRSGAGSPSGCSFSEPMFREIAQANVFFGDGCVCQRRKVEFDRERPCNRCRRPARFRGLLPHDGPQSRRWPVARHSRRYAVSGARRSVEQWLLAASLWRLSRRSRSYD